MPLSFEPRETRITISEGDPQQSVIDHATGYRSSGVPTLRKDFASGDGLIQKHIRELQKRGLRGKGRVRISALSSCCLFVTW